MCKLLNSHTDLGSANFYHGTRLLIDTKCEELLFMDA